jgi:SAM-dependent methyltransferase
MNRFKSIARNLRLLLTKELTEQIGEVEARLSQRADAYEQTVDGRIEERFASLRHQSAERADQYEVALDQRFEERIGGAETRLDERLGAAETRADKFETALDQRFEERLGAAETQLDKRWNEAAELLEKRLVLAEQLADERTKLAELRADERTSLAEKRLDERADANEERLEQRFSQRAQDLDARFDNRASKLERYVDERFVQLEQSSDERMERHERKVDKMVRQMSTDLVERTDVMLQIFDQRLDKQRRELRAATTPSPADNQTETAAANEDLNSNGATPQQLASFRKLANVATHAQTRIKQTGETALYEQILSWKKTAQEGLNDFTPDERETADYILSFLDDPREIDYVKQHLRRFVSTLNRIPPAQSRHDRLLELGSLSHLAPAIKKYCGYAEVYGADFWETDEQVSQETVTQKRITPGAQPETHTFELRNFNVERDPFPYPDDHFRVVLCCELIEHLQSDPMHMLWECNRVLAKDGWLLLTTPNIASARAIEGLLVGCAPYLLAQYNTRVTADQHNREYAPYELGVALAAAGFTVVELETEDVWTRSNPAILDLLKQVQISTELRGDNIFALARKAGAPVERYPKELYID